MAKALFIAEKPSVAQEFAKALGETMRRGDGFVESDSYVVTWCVGHLVTMSYPEVYDPKYKRWSLSTLPFLPDNFLYEVIPGVKKQYTDRKRSAEPAGRGYDLRLYRLGAGGRVYLPPGGADGRRERERRGSVSGSIPRQKKRSYRGIREAKDLSDYDNLAGCRLPAGQGGLPDGHQFFPAADLKIWQYRFRTIWARSIPSFP